MLCHALLRSCILCLAVPFLLFTAVPFEAMLRLCWDTPVGQQPFPAVVHTHLLLAITFLHRKFTVSQYRRSSQAELRVPTGGGPLCITELQATSCGLWCSA